MKYPVLSDDARFARLEPPKGPVRMVLDTDTYNEIDDQFAVVYALLSQEKLRLEAIYAAPFLNERSNSPGDGMAKSFDEILRLLERLGVSPEGLAHRGSTAFLSDSETPCRSAAAQDLVARAMAGGEEPLYVAAIGAITNVASAILMEPSIIERIVVVWLAGDPLSWPHSNEFNLRQDIHASRLIFDCGVPLVQIPCHGVASHLLTTVPELEQHVKGRGAIGDYLVQIFKDYVSDSYAWAKEIWDISAIAYLLDPDWTPTELARSPILSPQLAWRVDDARHWIRRAFFVHRNPIFADLFRKLEAHGRNTAVPK